MDNDGTLDKEATSYNDIFDAYQLNWIACLDEAQAFDEAQKLFFQIPDTMLKCAGLIETNEEEYDACIDVLFKFMILGRQFLMDWK